LDEMKLTKLNKKDFGEILENYEIGKYKSSQHIRYALANTVYVLKTTKGKYILKIFEHGDSRFIKNQIKVIDQLFKSKIPVAKILKMENGSELLLFNKKKISIQKYLDGDAPKSLNDYLIKNIAKNMALMHKSLSNIKIIGKFSWRTDHEFKPLKDKYNIESFDLVGEEKKLLEELNDIDKRKLRKGIVHGDFHGINLIIKKNKVVAIIDWDDMHNDFIIYDIAVFLAHSFIGDRKFGIIRIKLFLKEYQKHLKLNDNELNAIYFFIKQRFLTVINWHFKQMIRHKDLIKNLNKSVNQQIKRYSEFIEISQEELR